MNKSNQITSKVTYGDRQFAPLPERGFNMEKIRSIVPLSEQDCKYIETNARSLGITRDDLAGLIYPAIQKGESLNRALSQFLHAEYLRTKNK